MPAVSYFLCCTRGKVRNKTERSCITLNELLDPIIIMLTISLRAEHFPKEVFDVTSQIIFQIKKNKDTEKNVIVLLTSFTSSGSSKRRVKYRLFSLLRKTYVVDVDCSRCTQPGAVMSLKDIKNIWPSPHVSKPARAGAFFGSLKTASFLVELVFRLHI